MLYYPANLPVPLQNGYSRTKNPNMVRTSMTDGHVLQRLINQGAPDSLTVNFLFNSAQYAEFLSWYKSEINSGAYFFVLPLISEETGGVSYEYCRIKNGQFSASLECRNRTDSAYWKINATLDVSNSVSDSGIWANYYMSGTPTEHVLEKKYTVTLSALNKTVISEDSDIVSSFSLG